MGYRASKQASIKQSPYYMLLQRQMRLPIDVEMLPPSDSTEDNLDGVVDALIVSREKAFRKAQENIKSTEATGDVRQKTSRGDGSGHSSP